MKDTIFPYMDDILYVLGAGFILYLVVKGIKRKKEKSKKVTQSSTEDH
jgi:threonine/homoserine/homoserine lactone efflux protein